MTDPESYPSKPEQAYLEYVAEIMNEVSKPVIQELGALVIDSATSVVMEDARAQELVDDISDYKDKNDMSAELSATLDKPFGTGIVEGAERHLQQYAKSFEASPFNVPSLQTEAERIKTLSEINGMLAQGQHEKIYGLTINKATAIHRINSAGDLEYQAASGQWISEVDVDNAHKHWQDNPTALQKAKWFVSLKTIATKPNKQ